MILIDARYCKSHVHGFALRGFIYSHLTVGMLVLYFTGSGRWWPQALTGHLGALRDWLVLSEFHLERIFGDNDIEAIKV